MNSPTIQDVEAAVRSVLFDQGGPRATSRRRDGIFTERLFSMRHAEALPRGTREVCIAPGTVVTPLARDFLKRQSIALRIVARAEVEASRRPGEWGLAIATETGLISALRRALLDEGAAWLEVGPSAEAAARWVAESTERGAFVLTDEASVAVWRGCLVPGVRAATAGDLDAVDRAVDRLGVNLLVVEPAGKSINLMRQMSRTFRNAGAPRAPGDLQWGALS